MRSHWLIGLLFAVVMNAPATAARLKLLQIPADAAGPVITVAVWYPSADAPSPVTFGPFTVSAAKGGAVSGHGLPLVVLSHGRGGSFVGHHDTAEHLADAGFVVAALNHPGDTTLDKSRIGEMSVYVERPLDVKRVIDYMTGASPLAAAIDPNRIGLYGFSRGGYTGLVAIGANPDSTLIKAAERAGGILKKYYGSDFQVSNKEGVNNLVTEADHAAEKAIMETIRNEALRRPFGLVDVTCRYPSARNIEFSRHTYRDKFAMSIQNVDSRIRDRPSDGNAARRGLVHIVLRQPQSQRADCSLSGSVVIDNLAMRS